LLKNLTSNLKENITTN